MIKHSDSVRLASDISGGLRAAANPSMGIATVDSVGQSRPRDLRVR
ncbi:hypothetical protein FAGKG844_310024 [Frankia sp. AgKG'84/4]